jgi:DNA-binding MarR family transcriptional regulator
MSPLNYLGDLRPAFVAHLADRLNDEICRETQAHADSMGIRAPAKTYSALLYLHLHGAATLTRIAKLDGQSHQLLAARLAPLEQLGLIERFDDPDDGRARPYRLTRSGREEAKKVLAATSLAAQAMRQLFVELGLDLVEVLEGAIEGLRVEPLGARMRRASAPARHRAAAKRGATE